MSYRVIIGGLVIVGAVVGGCFLVFSGGGESPVRSDEEIVFFPTSAALSADGKQWSVDVHGWIFEPEQDSVVRGTALGVLRRTFGLEKGTDEADLFKERGRQFLVDNERGKTISVRFGERLVRMPASGANGHFSGVVNVPVVECEQLDRDSDERPGWIRYQAVLRDDDQRSFLGQVRLIPTAGISVISDIDDTIKISQVNDREQLVRNTFLRPYKDVPGMSELFTGWAASGACFHYVSNSPWQLFRSLESFLAGQGFPDGSYHLRHFRVKDKSFAKFLTSGGEHKTATIERLLKAYPYRTFVLVGDCGERDPEIYAGFGRRYPDQVEKILLRDPTGDGEVTPRLEEALGWSSACEVAGV